MRKATKKIRIGDRYIGGGEPVLIQSMTNTKTQDVKATLRQIKELEEEGCEIIRVAVPDSGAAAAIREIRKNIAIPLVADIHFDYRLAIDAIKNGADKIRINPGNIGDTGSLRKIVDTAREYGIPIRIGVNSGSLERELLEKYGGPTSDALVESAVRNVRLLEAMDFNDMVISIKSSDVLLSVESYTKISSLSDYPLHLGVTEAGTVLTGSVKSSVGLGILLYNGIGDTIRVSLTGDPGEEIFVAKELLKSLKLFRGGIEVVSCPTCGRCNVDLIRTAEEVEKELRHFGKTGKSLKIAVMGCAVNGPGEAREADLGIAGGKGEFLLFVKGEIIRKIPQENAVAELLEEVKKLLQLT